jgi:hypothetical protein
MNLVAGELEWFDSRRDGSGVLFSCSVWFFGITLLLSTGVSVGQNFGLLKRVVSTFAEVI